MTTLCAVGDSYVFGAELVRTHCAKEIADFTEEDIGKIEWNIHENAAYRGRYNALLDSMRFTSLLAKKLGYDHINYALGGASQEGIKFQAYQLLARLADLKINPADTVWVVGLTAQTRVMMINHIIEYYQKKLSSYSGIPSYVWSRLSSRTMVYGREPIKSDTITRTFAKEYTENVSPTQLALSWTMNVIDTVNLLRSAGVHKIHLLNLWDGTIQFLKHSTELPDITIAEVERMLAAHKVIDHILPGLYSSITEVLPVLASEECPGGHPDKHSQIKIAEYIYDLI
jgi:hypothetical protein